MGDEEKPVTIEAVSDINEVALREYRKANDPLYEIKEQQKTMEQKITDLEARLADVTADVQATSSQYAIVRSPEQGIESRTQSYLPYRSIPKAIAKGTWGAIRAFKLHYPIVGMLPGKYQTTIGERLGEKPEMYSATNMAAEGVTTLVGTSYVASLVQNPEAAECIILTGAFYAMSTAILRGIIARLGMPTGSPLTYLPLKVGGYLWDGFKGVKNAYSTAFEQAREPKLLMGNDLDDEPINSPPPSIVTGGESPAPQESLQKRVTLEQGLLVRVGNRLYCVEASGRFELSDWEFGFLACTGDRIYSSIRNLNTCDIIDVLTGELIARPQGTLWTLGINGDTLLDGGNYGGIFSTIDGKIIHKTKQIVTTLTGHEGRLYHAESAESTMKRGSAASGKSFIFDTRKGKKIATRESTVRILASHDGALYDGGFYNKIYNTLTNEVVAERQSTVWALTSYRGMLIDSESRYIYDTLNDTHGRRPLFSFSGAIDSMISVPMPLWEELAKKGKRVQG